MEYKIYRHKGYQGRINFREAFDHGKYVGTIRNLGGNHRPSKQFLVTQGEVKNIFDTVFEAKQFLENKE